MRCGFTPRPVHAPAHEVVDDVTNGYEPSMGARPMRRLIQKEIEDPLSIAILERTDPSLTEISVDFSRGSLKVSFEPVNIKVTARISQEEVVHQTVK